MANKDLTFRLFGEDATASSSLRRLSIAADKTGKQFERSFSKTKAVLGGAALAAAGAVALLVKTGVGEALDASAGLAQLQAGIKSTGNAAGVTTDGMENLASSIQDYSGQTDDSIVKTEQLLLTFTNIKNRGPNKIFDETTKAAADMAAKMGGDASSKAVLLGKALNDPAVGLAKLTKVGVTFTDGQKKQVAAMVKAGNTAGAQKIILGELNREFGGAAKAAGESLPGQLQRVQRAFEDVSQTVIEAILPVVTPMIGKITAAIIASTPTLQAWAEKFAEFGSWVAANLPMIMQIAGVILGLVVAFKTVAMIIEIVRVATIAWTAVQWLLNSALLANPIGLIVLAIGILIGIIVLLVTHWSQVCAFLQTVWGAVCKWFTDTITAIGASWAHGWQQIANFFTGLWRVLAGWFQGVWNGIVANFAHGANQIRTFIGAAVTWIQTRWVTFWSGMATVGRAVLAVIVAYVRNYINGVRTVISTVMAAIRGGWNAAWNGIRNVVTVVGRGVLTAVHTILTTVAHAITGSARTLYDAGKHTIQGFINGIRAMFGSVWAVISSLAGGVIDTFKRLLGIHSPSRVFEGHGKNIAQGLINGLVGHTAGVHAAVAGLVPGLDGSGIGVNVAAATVGGGGTVAANRAAGGVIVNVTVQGAMVGTTAQLGQVIVNAIQTGAKQGAIPKNVFTTL